MVKDIVHSFYHKKMDEEIKRVLIECNKNGIFINKKEATLIIAEKSRRNIMSFADMQEFLRRFRNVSYKK